MTGLDKRLGLAAAVVLLFSISSAPAKAQFGGDGDMMTQFAPMLEMMKAKMGKRRFGQLMQTVGPMMGHMMENGGGGFGGMMGGMGGGGFGGQSMSGGFSPDGNPMTGNVMSGMGGGGFGGIGGGNIMGMLGGAGGGEMMSMLPQLISLANMGGGHRNRRHRRR